MEHVRVGMRIIPISQYDLSCRPLEIRLEGIVVFMTHVCVSMQTIMDFIISTFNANLAILEHHLEPTYKPWSHPKFNL